MDGKTFADWVYANMEGEEIHCKKDQVYVLSCGTKTYTWFIKEGVLFTALQTESSEGELANTIWRKGDMVHSLDDDIMLPFHALTDCTLFRCSSKQLNAHIRESAELSFMLAEHYHNQFTHTLGNYRHAALDNSEDRLEHYERIFSEIDELEGEGASDATLALFLGMHRVSVSRIRKKLQKQKAENGGGANSEPKRQK